MVWVDAVMVFPVAHCHCSVLVDVGSRKELYELRDIYMKVVNSARSNQCLVRGVRLLYEYCVSVCIQHGSHDVRYKAPLRGVVDLGSRGCRSLKRGNIGVPTHIYI